LVVLIGLEYAKFAGAGDMLQLMLNEVAIEITVVICCKVTNQNHTNYLLADISLTTEYLLS